MVFHTPRVIKRDTMDRHPQQTGVDSRLGHLKWSRLRLLLEDLDVLVANFLHGKVVSFIKDLHTGVNLLMNLSSRWRY